MAHGRITTVAATVAIVSAGACMALPQSFRDTFDSVQSVAAWSADLGEWEVRDETYQETSLDYRTVTLREGRLYDFDLTVRLQFIEVRREYEAAGYAVVALRAQDADHYYAVIARQNGTVAIAEFNRYPSERRSMWQPVARLVDRKPELALGKWYVIGVQVHGAKVAARVYEPGAEPEGWDVEADFGETADCDHAERWAYVRGRVGLGASHARVAFDDLDVQPLRSIAELADVLSVVRRRAEQTHAALRAGARRQQAARLLTETEEFARRLAQEAPASDEEWQSLETRVAGLGRLVRDARKRALLERGGLAAACPYAGLTRTTAYKGNLSISTNHSTGGKYPEEAARLYKAAGYSFVSFTDEDAYGDQDGGVYYPRLQGDEEAHDWNGDGKTYPARIYGSGLEAYVRDYAKPAPPWASQNWKLDRPGEFVVLSGIRYASGHPPIACVGYPPGPAFRPRDDYGFLDVLQRAGGLAFLCHPAVVNRTPEVVYEDDNLRRLGGLEVYNGYFARRGDIEDNEDGSAGIATELWDACLDRGMRLWGLANDDTHSYNRDAADSPFNGFNIVSASALTRAAILEALRGGRFYASSGLLVDEIEATASSLRVEAKAARRIRVIGAGGKVLKEVEGDGLVYELDGSERWIRVELENDERVVPEKDYTQRAWLQPLFLDDLLKGRADKRARP